MSNPNKAKGTHFESAIVTYLKDNGIRSAHRVAQTGRLDSGDIHGVSPFIIQAKNYADIPTALRVGLAGAQRQAPIAGEPFGAAVIKRRQRPVADSYVVLDLATFTRLLQMLRS